MRDLAGMYAGMYSPCRHVQPRHVAAAPRPRFATSATRRDDGPARRALSVPYKRLLDPARPGGYLTPPQMRRVLLAAGVDPAWPAVCYCNGGVASTAVRPPPPPSPPPSPPRVAGSRDARAGPLPGTRGSGRVRAPAHKTESGDGLPGRRRISDGMRVGCVSEGLAERVCMAPPGVSGLQTEGR